VVTVVSGIIAAVLASALFIAVRTSADNGLRSTESHDVQQTGLYFTPDGQNARSVVLRPTAPCGSATLTGATPVAELDWQAQGVASAATYYVTPSGTSGEPVLRRRLCVAGAEVADLLLVANLDPGALPTVSCDPVADCHALPAGSWIRLQVHQRPFSNGTQTDFELRVAPRSVAAPTTTSTTSTTSTSSTVPPTTVAPATAAPTSGPTTGTPTTGPRATPAPGTPSP